jgi:hypothetical protein
LMPLFFNARMVSASSRELSSTSNMTDGLIFPPRA